MTTLTFACRCGGFRGSFESLPDRDTHLTCHCADCRAFVRATSGEDPGIAGVGIVQTAPERLRIERGAAHLRAMVLSRRGGLIRWYAGCCGTPIAATPRTPAVPFVGLLRAPIAGGAELGPVLMRGFLPRRHPDGRQRHEGLGTLIARMIRRSAASRVSGRWRANPFFADGRPVAEPRPPDPEARAAAYA